MFGVRPPQQWLPETPKRRFPVPGLIALFRAPGTKENLRLTGAMTGAVCRTGFVGGVAARGIKHSG
jgi:hypothetical protein